MDEDSLQSDLENLLRARYEPVFEAQREQAIRDSKLTDDELWNERIEEARATNPDFARMTEEHRAEFISQRHSDPERWSKEALEALVAREASDLLPEIVSLRESEGRTGPLTEEEYCAASNSRSEKRIAWCLSRFQDAAANHPDGHKRDFFRAFAEGIQQDSNDLTRLQEDPTEERLEEVTRQIVDRLADLTDRLKQPPTEGS